MSRISSPLSYPYSYILTNIIWSSYISYIFPLFYPHPLYTHQHNLEFLWCLVYLPPCPTPIPYILINIIWSSYDVLISSPLSYPHPLYTHQHNLEFLYLVYLPPCPTPTPYTLTNIIWSSYDVSYIFPLVLPPRPLYTHQHNLEFLWCLVYLPPYSPNKQNLDHRSLQHLLEMARLIKYFEAVKNKKTMEILFSSNFVKSEIHSFKVTKCQYCSLTLIILIDFLNILIE